MTQDALLEALRKALQAAPDPEDAYTAEELVKMLGIHRKKLLAAIAILWERGEVETCKVRRQKPTRLATVDAYRFKAASVPRP